MLVPQVDESGNEIAGLISPELAVPLATYTGWQPVKALYLPLGQGVYVPFPRTRAEREATMDPRSSIEERYQNREQYLGLIAEEALALIGQNYLLAEDLPAILRNARRHWDYLVPGS